MQKEKKREMVVIEVLEEKKTDVQELEQSLADVSLNTTKPEETLSETKESAPLNMNSNEHEELSAFPEEEEEQEGDEQQEQQHPEEEQEGDESEPDLRELELYEKDNVGSEAAVQISSEQPQHDNVHSEVKDAQIRCELLQENNVNAEACSEVPNGLKRKIDDSEPTPNDKRRGLGKLTERKAVTMHLPPSLDGDALAPTTATSSSSQNDIMPPLVSQESDGMPPTVSHNIDEIPLPTQTSTGQETKSQNDHNDYQSSIDEVQTQCSNELQQSEETSARPLDETQTLNINQAQSTEETAFQSSNETERNETSTQGGETLPQNSDDGKTTMIEATVVPLETILVPLETIPETHLLPQDSPIAKQQKKVHFEIDNNARSVVLPRTMLLDQKAAENPNSVHPKSSKPSFEVKIRDSPNRVGCKQCIVRLNQGKFTEQEMKDCVEDYRTQMEAQPPKSVEVFYNVEAVEGWWAVKNAETIRGLLAPLHEMLESKLVKYAVFCSNAKLVNTAKDILDRFYPSKVPGFFGDSESACKDFLKK